MKDLGYKLRVLLCHLWPSPFMATATMAMEGYTDWEVDVEERDIRRAQMEDFKKLLLTAPDGQLDASMRPLIEKWDSPAKAIQVLEVLDHCVHASLASGFTVRLLQMLYDAALKNEGVTHEDVAKLATWRT